MLAQPEKADPGSVTAGPSEAPAPAPTPPPEAARPLHPAALLPLPLLSFAILALWAWPPAGALRSPGLLLSLNLLFTTLVSFLVAHLASRGFLVGGKVGLLLLAVGAEVWGIAPVFATLAGWSSPNVAVTIHNSCALLSAAAHLAGAFASRTTAWRVRRVDAVLLAALAAGLVLPGAVAGAALAGATPTFFVQGAGGTPIRQAVGGGAVAMFAAAALLLGTRRPATPFSSRYALALGTVAAGMLGVLLQESFGSALNWTARLAQWVGGVYMLWAAVATVRASHRWALSLEAGLADARSALRAREERYEAFFASLREAVVVTEAVRAPGGEVSDWIVREANALFIEALGVPRSQLIDRPLSALAAAEPLRALVPQWERVLSSGEPISLEREVGGRTFQVSAFRLDARTVAAAGLDVTERRRVERALRDSERIYRAIGESIDYGVWVCAPDGRNLYASESFLRLVGMTQAQCSDFGWGDVLHPEDSARTIAAWKECVRAGGTWDMEHRYRGVDGAWHPVLARGVPVRDEAGEVVCWAGINLDIARLKRAEEGVRDSDRRKSEFLAVLSHELRNPLGPILNSVRLLAVAPPDSVQAARAREVVERQAEHLTRLVDDLLDVTRIERGKVELARRRVDLRELVLRTCDDHRPLFGRRGVSLHVETGAPAAVDADPTRLAQVLGNLLQNAAKFTPEGGNVRVTLGVEGGAAALRVEDDGVGVEPALLARIFEPFVQAERGLARTQGGLGLGLAVVKGLVELHGGAVAARSDGPGEGTTLTVTLPLAPAAGAPAPAGAGTAAARSLDILVVEDGEDAATTLADLLELDGHRVRVARDGRSGIARAREAPPDVVLCDIGLPDVDGYGVARALRADPALAGTWLVALSGYALPEDRARSRAAGFDRHLAKPPRREELEDALAEVARARPAPGAPGR